MQTWESYRVQLLMSNLCVRFLQLESLSGPVMCFSWKRHSYCRAKTKRSASKSPGNPHNNSHNWWRTLPAVANLSLKYFFPENFGLGPTPRLTLLESTIITSESRINWEKIAVQKLSQKTACTHPQTRDRPRIPGNSRAFSIWNKIIIQRLPRNHQRISPAGHVFAVFLRKWRWWFFVVIL